MIGSGLGDRHQQNGVNYTLDLAAGLTQVLADDANIYLYGNGRISQSQITNPQSPEYFLGDALGSVRQLADTTGAVTLTQSYAPYGDTVSSVGNGHSAYQYTGEIRDASRMTYLRARYLDSRTGRFISRDTWAGIIEKPLSLNRWNYGYSNPVQYTDPTGHYICEKYNCGHYGDNSWIWNGSLDRQDRLFSMVFKGSNSDGTWNDSDWKYYCRNRNTFYMKPHNWRNPDTEKGWSLFALHAGRLASHYSTAQRTEFVRDFALLFSGIQASSHWTTAALSAARGPNVLWQMDDGTTTRSYLRYRNDGLDSDYLENNKKEDQSHHYVGFFFLG